MKCEHCNNDFHILDMTTYEDKKVCKICKVRLIQSKKVVLFCKKERKNYLTQEQKDYVNKNIDKIKMSELAKELNITVYAIRCYLNDSGIKKKKRIL